MNFLTFSQILTDEKNQQVLFNNDIDFYSDGDKSNYIKYDRNFMVRSDKSRVEQRIKIYEQIYIDGGSYNERSELTLETFNLLDILLKLINFKDSYEEYLKIRKIIRAREVISDNCVYLVLYFFVDDFLAVLNTLQEKVI